MPRAAYTIAFCAALTACGAAKASDYDSTNPVHCLAIFGATSGAAGNGPLADQLNTRILYLVHANGGAQWLKEAAPASLEIGARWEASGDRDQAIALFEQCRTQQDADPNFRASIPVLLPEGRQISSGR